MKTPYKNKWILQEQITQEQQEEQEPPEVDWLEGDLPTKKPEQKKEGETDDEGDDSDGEEEEEEEPKNTPDEEPKPGQKPPEKKGKTPDESFAALRKGRDEARAGLKAYQDVLGEHKPEVLKPVLDLILESHDGVVDDATVAEWIESKKNADVRIKELEDALNEKEDKIAQIDIQHSTEFKTKFLKPAQEAEEALLFEFAQTVKRGDKREFIAPKATADFHNFLKTNSGQLTVAEISEQRQIFIKAFKAESGGEEPDVPSVKSLLTATRDFDEKKVNLQTAHQDWKKKKKEMDDQAIIEEESNRTTIQNRNKRERKLLASKAFREFDIAAMAPGLEDTEVKAMFDEELADGEALFDGKKTPSYDFMMQRGVKARLYDKILPELIELRKLADKVKKGKRNNIRGSGQPGSSDEKDDGKDWLDN